MPQIMLEFAQQRASAEYSRQRAGTEYIRYDLDEDIGQVEAKAAPDMDNDTQEDDENQIVVIESSLDTGNENDELTIIEREAAS